MKPILPSMGTVSVVFLLVSALAAPAANVTFRVDMSVQTAMGQFDPANDFMYVAANFNSWSTSAESGLQYQFVLNNGGIWESTGNRYFTLPSTNATTIPMAFFNNQPDLGPIAMDPISGGQTTLSWTAGPNIWLQSAGSLTGTWQDVDGSQGQGTAVVTVGPGAKFFRLRGP